MATNADLIKALREWKNDVVAITVDYKDSISALSEIEKNFKSNKLELLKSYAFPLAQVVTVVAIVGFLIFFSTRVPCGVTIKYLGAEISRVCN